LFSDNESTKRKDLIVKPGFYFILFSYLQLNFISFRFALFISFPY
jgi:hypothetical protein